MSVTRNMRLAAIVVAMATTGACGSVPPAEAPASDKTSKRQSAVDASAASDEEAKQGGKVAAKKTRIAVEPITADGSCNYAELVKKTPQLSTYAQLAQSVGWLAKHRDDKGVTFLLPVNAAFDALDGKARKRLDSDRKWLNNVLANHTFMGTLQNSYFATKVGSKVSSLSQARDGYEVSSGAAKTNRIGAAELRQQIKCGGVVLHVVDAVLLPRRFDPARSKNPMRASIWYLEK